MSDHRLQIVLAAKDITGKAFTKLQGRMTSLMKSAVSLRGATVALAGAAGIGMLVKSSLDAADKIGKTADKLGITTDALQEYQFMASQSGVATRTMEMGLQRFTRRMAEAVQGKGELKSILEQYSVAVIDAAGNTRKSSDVLADLADVIKGVEDPAERLRIAFKAFDSEGVAMLNTMKAGSAGLNAWAQEARNLGLVMDKELIRNAEKANDELDKLTKVVKIHFTSAIASLAPHIARITSDITNWTVQNKQDIEDLVTTTGKLVNGFVKLLGVAGRIGEVTGVFGMIQHAADSDRFYGVEGSWMEEGEEALNKYKEAIGQTVSETNRLADATNRVKEATLAEAEAMAAVYQQQYDVAVEGYTARLQEMAAAEAEAAIEMINFQQQVDEMNGIMSNTSTWDLMQDQINATADAAKSATGVADDAANEIMAAFERTQSMIAGGMTNALMDMIDGTKSARKAFRDMTKDIIRQILKMIIQQQILNALTSALGGMGFAKGAAFDESCLVTFAQGGIVDRPTVFPFASGVGLMAEKGPEAIMPLTRTSGGDLGVKAEGGGGMVTNNFNIVAVDSKSFADIVHRNPGSIVKVVDDAMTSNTSLRSTMRKTL